MFTSFLIKYAEIGIKGKNRYLFEDALVRQIKYALKKCEGEFLVHKTQGRIFVDAESEFDYDEVVAHLQRVFGISGICPVVHVQDEGFEKLCETVIDYIAKVYPDCNQTFKVAARRARKNYPKDSMTINMDMGEAILKAYPNMKVDVHHPDIMLNIEIREEIYIYSVILPGPGGMPVGTGGKGMLLLSGGIDSPVAGYMIAKRGVKIDAVYFHAPPYTSERAKQKVVDLAKIVARYTGPIYLHVINFTDIQLYIYEKCPHEELTIIMRRYMMRIAEQIAKETECLGLITGESIGQVASQTMNSLIATNEVCELPVYRPQMNPDTLFHVDAVQGFGKSRIYPKKMHIDLLSVSGHKIHGPKGVGLLYVGERVKIQPIVFGGGQQQNLRSGTENVPGIAGLAKAAEMLYSHFDEDHARLCACKRRFIEGVERLDQVKVNGLLPDAPYGEGTAAHIVSVSFAGVRSEVLLHALEDKGIYVSAGSACSAHKPQPSATLKAIGIDKSLLDSTIRFSFSVFTTEEEIDVCLQALYNIVPMLRRYSRR